ncbi:MAG: hypothetical protein CSA29_05465 [Desulfobacterales bacterium]|nr:MAG: hypothetical protein CSA29_05465 [Desulfobacterales bacterium]
MKRVVASVLFFLSAACIHDVASSDKTWIRISQFPTGRVLEQVALGRDKIFSLSFIHSVSNTLVTDVYQVRDKRIYQTQEIFSAHGAGLPSGEDEPGAIKWGKKNGRFILHMTRDVEPLVVRTDKNYKNRLMVCARTIDLNKWEDQALRLSIVP